MRSWQILLVLLAALQCELVYAVSSIAGLYSDILNYDEPSIYHPIEKILADYDHISPHETTLGYRDALPDLRTLGHTKHKLVVMKDISVDSHHDSDVHHLFPAPSHDIHYITPQHYYTPYNEPHWKKIKRIEYINEHDGHGFRKLIEYDFSRAADSEMMQHLFAKRETNTLYAKQNISNINLYLQNALENERDKRALYSSYFPVRPLYPATYLPMPNYFKKPAYIYPSKLIPPIPYYPTPFKYQTMKNSLLYPNLYNPYLLKRYRRDTGSQLGEHKVPKRFTLLHFPHSHHKTLSTFHSIHHPALLYHHFRDAGARNNSGQPTNHKARNNHAVVDGSSHNFHPSHDEIHTPPSHLSVPPHNYGRPSEPLKPQNHPGSPPSYHMSPTNQQQSHFLAAKPMLVHNPAEHISYPDHSQHPEYLVAGHQKPAELISNPHHPAPVQHTQHPPHAHIWPQVYYPQQFPTMK